MSVGAVAFVFCIGLCSCGKRDVLSTEDKKLSFGEQGISIITEVDSNDASKVVMQGALRVEAGRIINASDEPGGVVVVGVKEGWHPEGKHYAYRHILLRNSKHVLILAPPRTVLTISKKESLFGESYEPGTFSVPEDSKFPEKNRSDNSSRADAAPTSAGGNPIGSRGGPSASMIEEAWQSDFEQFVKEYRSVVSRDSNQVRNRFDGKRVQWSLTFSGIKEPGGKSELEFEGVFRPLGGTGSLRGPAAQFYPAASYLPNWKTVRKGTRVTFTGTIDCRLVSWITDATNGEKLPGWPSIIEVSLGKEQVSGPFASPENLAGDELTESHATDQSFKKPTRGMSQTQGEAILGKGTTNWRVTGGKISPIEGAYTSDDGLLGTSVSIQPPEQRRLVRASCRLSATAPDPQAIEKYVKTPNSSNLSNDDRKQLVGKYRTFDMKDLLLLDGKGNKYRAIYIAKPQAIENLSVGPGGIGRLSVGSGASSPWLYSRSVTIADDAVFGKQKVRADPGSGNSYCALAEVGGTPIELEAVFQIDQDTDLNGLKLSMEIKAASPQTARDFQQPTPEESRPVATTRLPPSSAPAVAPPVIRSRGSVVTASRTWECPKCGTILQKGNLGKIWNPGDPIASVGGRSTCGGCRAVYEQADVYGGKYDVNEKATKQGQPDDLEVRVSVVTFRHFSLTPPKNATEISSAILANRYPRAILGKNYVIGLTDSITPDEAKVQYTANVREKMLPDLGNQFDVWTGKDITGTQVTTLFFR